MRIVVSLPLVLRGLRVPNARSRVYKRLPRQVKGMAWRHCAVSVSSNVLNLLSSNLEHVQSSCAGFAVGYRGTGAKWDTYYIDNLRQNSASKLAPCSQINFLPPH
jgi:hypothetical protein